MKNSESIEFSSQNIKVDCTVRAPLLLSSPLHLRRDDRVSLCSAISPFRATLATRSASPRAFLPALPAPHSPRLNSTTMPPLILTMVRHGESMDNLRVSFIPQLVTCA